MGADRPKFILVVGHESSGNRLAANTLARATGFDYDDGETHLDDQGLVKSTYLHHTVQQWWDDPDSIVCDHSRITRRSIPHGGADIGPLRFVDHPLTGRHNPNPLVLVNGLKRAGYDVYVVITVRDGTIATLSKFREHTDGGLKAAQRELDEAVDLLREVMEQHDQCFVFSYESLMLLGEPYVQQLYRFVGIESVYMPPLKNANPKYVKTAPGPSVGRSLTVGTVTRENEHIWGGDLRALNSVITGLRACGVKVVTAQTAAGLHQCHLAFISNSCDDRRPEMRSLRARNIPYGYIGFHEDFSLYYPVSMGFTEYACALVQGIDADDVHPSMEELWENPDVVQQLNHKCPNNIVHNITVLRQALFCQAASATEADTLRRDCPQAKIETVYWDLPLFRENSEADDEFLKLTGLTSGEYILQVGRMETRKNQLASVLATRNIDVPLVFIASKGYQDWYELHVVNAAAKFRKAPTILVSQNYPTQNIGNGMRIIQMPGGERLSEACLVSAFRHCGLHLHPAFYEAPGYTNLEAAHIGVPTVASAWGTLRDYCTFGGGDAAMVDRFEYVIPYHLASLEAAVQRNFGRKVTPDLDHPIFRRTTEDVGRETLAIIEKYLPK